MLRWIRNTVVEGVKIALPRLFAGAVWCSLFILLGYLPALSISLYLVGETPTPDVIVEDDVQSASYLGLAIGICLWLYFLYSVIGGVLAGLFSRKDDRWWHSVFVAIGYLFTVPIWLLYMLWGQIRTSTPDAGESPYVQGIIDASLDLPPLFLFGGGGFLLVAVPYTTIQLFFLIDSWFASDDLDNSDDLDDVE